MKAAEIMTHHPVVCEANLPLQECARLMTLNDCGEIPVVDSLTSMRVTGVITDRDIVVRALAEGKNPLQLKVKDCFTTPAVTIRADLPVQSCIQLMEDHQIRRLPVVDKNERCCGMISQADVARKLGAYDAADVLREVSRPKGFDSGRDSQQLPYSPLM